MNIEELKQILTAIGITVHPDMKDPKEHIDGDERLARSFLINEGDGVPEVANHILTMGKNFSFYTQEQIVVHPNTLRHVVRLAVW